MPKKMNRYEMQNYVPEGNADGGQYTFDGGSSNGGGSGRKGGNRKPKTNDPSSKADVKTHQDFHEYIERNHSGDFGKSLTENFDTGNDDAKTVINGLIKKGVKIEESKNGQCYTRNGIVVVGGIDNFGKYSYKAKGEVFYHEFWHAADDGFLNILTREDIETLANKYGFNTYYYNRGISTAKILSNGKTLLDTLNEECHKISVNKAGGKWDAIIDAYRDEVNNELKNINTDKAHETLTDYEEESKKLFPTFDDNGVYLYGNERKRLLWLNSNKEYKDAKQQLDDAEMKAKTKVFKHWGSISDIYGLYNKISYGFGSGHPSSYAKVPGSIAREFMAEYGSARSRNDDDAKKELALFKKYFPEASKCAEEIFNMVLKEARNNG